MSDFAHQDIYSWKEFYDFVLRLDQHRILSPAKILRADDDTGACIERLAHWLKLRLHRVPNDQGISTPVTGNRSITVFTPMHCFVWR